MNKRRKILLLGAGFTTRNLGVWALASGSIAAIAHAYPDAEIFLLDYHREPASYACRHRGGVTSVELLNIRFSKRLHLKNNIVYLLLMAAICRLLPFEAVRRRIRANNRWMDTLLEADLAASIAGGDSFSDIYGLGRLIYVSLPQILVLLAGRSLVVLPQTLGPFRTMIGRAIATGILKRAERVYSRDQDSIAENSGIIQKHSLDVQFSYDMAFALEPFPPNDPSVMPPLPQEGSDVIAVGLNVSGLLYIGGYTGGNMFGLKADYKAVIEAIVEMFLSLPKVQLFLIPHVLGDEGNPESDTEASQKLFDCFAPRAAGRLHLLPPGYDQHETKYVIGKMDFFMGARMHACIAALSQGVPAVGLAYSRKFAGVFQSLGVESLVVDLRHEDQAGILNKIRSLFEARATFGAQLNAKIPAIKERVLGLLNERSSPVQDLPGETEKGLKIPVLRNVTTKS